MCSKEFVLAQRHLAFAVGFWEVIDIILDQSAFLFRTGAGHTQQYDQLCDVGWGFWVIYVISLPGDWVKPLRQSFDQSYLHNKAPIKILDLEAWVSLSGWQYSLPHCHVSTMCHVLSHTDIERVTYPNSMGRKQWQICVCNPPDTLPYVSCPLADWPGSFCDLQPQV